MPHFAHPDEQLRYTFATQILRDHFVDQATFDGALAEWSEAGLCRYRPSMNSAIRSWPASTMWVPLATLQPAS